MRSRALLTLIVFVIAVPAAYYARRPATVPSAPRKAVDSGEMKMPHVELPSIEVIFSDPPEIFESPRIEFVPPIPVG